MCRSWNASFKRPSVVDLLLFACFMSHGWRWVASCFSWSFANVCPHSTHRRGLNPPHRVKSISMTTFTQQEIEFLQKHSNEVSYTPYNKGPSTTFWIVNLIYMVTVMSLILKWHFDIYSGIYTVNFPGIPLTLLISPFLVIPSPSPDPFTFPHLSPCFTPIPISLPPTLLIPLPPFRFVNTSGWASTTTGH